jgi:hypothetical protein
MEWGWVLLGAGALWAAYRTGRQAEQEKQERQRTTTLWHTEVQHLGLIAPIAALRGSGRISSEMAEEEIKLLNHRNPGLQSTWKDMTDDEKALVGVEFVALMDALEQRRRKVRDDKALRKWFPAVWEQRQREAESE